MKTRFALGTILIATQIEFPKSCTIDFFKDLLAPPIEVFCLFVYLYVCGSIHVSSGLTARLWLL